MSRVPSLGFIPPQLPSLTDQPPQGGNWIHEVKHDGYRTMLVIERGNARTFTRNGHDWSDRYPGIIMAARKLPCRTAILDGEVIVRGFSVKSLPASSSIRVLCIALVDGFFDYRAIRSADHDRLITYLSEPDHVADLHGGAVQIKCGSRPCQS